MDYKVLMVYLAFGEEVPIEAPKHSIAIFSWDNETTCNIRFRSGIRFGTGGSVPKPNNLHDICALFAEELQMLRDKGEGRPCKLMLRKAVCGSSANWALEDVLPDPERFQNAIMTALHKRM